MTTSKREGGGRVPEDTLGRKEIETRKSRLIAEANALRSDIRQDWKTIQPVLSHLELALQIAGQLKKPNMAWPIAFGLGVGGIASIMALKTSFISPLLNWAKILSDVFTFARNFTNSAPGIRASPAGSKAAEEAIR